MSLFSGRRAIFFDLDGTLVDSAPDLGAAVNDMLLERGRDAVAIDQVRVWVGNGARRLVMRALTGSRDGDPGDEVTQVALARFFEHYGRRLTERTRPYPGVVEALDVLTDMGLRLAVVTNKPARFTDPLLEALGLSHYFGVTVSGDTLASRKPDPAPLRHAASALGVPPDSAVMVGDSMADLGAARNAGIPMVLVPYGYRDGDAIFDAGPDLVVDDLRSLPACFPDTTNAIR